LGENVSIVVGNECPGVIDFLNMTNPLTKGARRHKTTLGDVNAKHHISQQELCHND